jgi:hypothetical protein
MTLKMSSGTLYLIALVQSDVSENTSSPFLGFLRVTVSTVVLPWKHLLRVSIERYY